MSAALAPKQAGLFDHIKGARLQMTESIEMTITSLAAYGATRKHWCIAWSGGKDSTALVTLVVWLILAGKVPAPKTLTVLYADTRQELLPLALSAASIREELEGHAPALAALGCELTVQTVMAPMDRRFLPYILGRGVPPPNNATLRWCTEKLKLEPMAQALLDLALRLGLGEMVERPTKARKVKPGSESKKPAAKAKPAKLVYRGHGVDKLLVLTGVRQGESAVRDGRIAMSCSKGDSECGQGWYQESLPTALCDTLAPILHWRVCHVWAWLKSWAPLVEFGDWSTELLADAYGGDEAEESGARTGCVGCPLVSEDRALERVLKNPKWAYLAPLRKLRELYTELRTPLVRLRKRAGETRADGSLVKNQQRMGPISLAMREAGLLRVLAIQAEVNDAADAQGRPRVDVINEAEVTRIRELIAAKTWPKKWKGDEPMATDAYEAVNATGSVQKLLFGALETA